MNKQTISAIQKQFALNASFWEDSPVYNISGFIRIEGPLDLERLKQAWLRVWAAAPLLHAGVAQGDDPAVVAPSAPWQIIDTSPEKAETEAKAIAARAFKLDQPPLVRVVVFRLGPQSHRLLIVQHHVVTDLYSKKLLSAAISRAYAEPDWRPSFVPYSEFTAREAAWLESASSAPARRYWQESLANPPPPLRLPAAGYSPGAFRARGSQLAWRLEPALADRLAAQEGAGRPPFLLLLGAWAALLARLSGQNHFFIGVPLSNRQDFEEQDLLGPCVNIVPLSVKLNPGSSLAELYQQVRHGMLLGHRHQRLPFLEIARHYQGERDPLRPWLLQAGFTNEPPMGLDLPGLDCQAQHLPRSGAQMDLFFTWWRGAEAWEGYWEYNEDSFGPAEIAYWQTAYARLLQALIDQPELPLSQVPLIDQEWADRLSGAAGSVPYPLQKSMADHLRESIARHSSQTALVWRGEAVDYARFGRNANRVAHQVLRVAGQGQRVVVLLERSPEMLYALHGIVAAGSAYVPLGIDWPVSRINDILDDIKPALVLTQAGYQDRFAQASCPVALVSELVASDGPDSPPELAIKPDDAMYILYTSGTTGRPKGAELPHAGIVNRLLWMQDAYRLVPGDRCLLKTPYTFDVSGWELFWPFLAGATLVIADEHLHKDPREIRDIIRRDGVRILHFVPSMLSHFLDQEGLEQLASLKDVVCSGEALTTEQLKRFFARLPGVKLHNLYGPTEASIDVSFWPCSPADIARGTVPIGLPIANTQIYVLDEAMNPCPPLVRGEIYLGGVGLAKGYWMRPELTAERFVPNPFGNGKLYRTGDWGRFGLDGAIEYLERKDNQVKIRGVRVELGEIETHLRELPRVENAIVKKGETASGSECLIAYYVSRDQQDLAVSEASAHLRDRLPGAIIPEFFVRLKAFPQSENGKIDRKALSAKVSQESAGAAPADQLEGSGVRVAALWRQVIGAPSLEGHSNFFDAGGNSLNLLKLRDLLEKEFGQPVGITELFRNPTVAGMASLFQQSTMDNGENSQSSSERAKKQQGYLAEMARRRKTSS